MPDSPQIPVAIALGANIGDRHSALLAALEALDSLPGFELVAVSRLYASAPWGLVDQPEFLNAVVAGRWSAGADGLLAALQAIERRLGKDIRERWGPRTIDLDVLLIGDERIDSPVLQVPHPRMSGRPFVVLPLRDVAAAVGGADLWRSHLALDREGEAIAGETRALADAIPWGRRLAQRDCRVVTRSPEETAALGTLLGAHASAGLVVALEGPLGAGKSRLVEGIARGLGLTEPIPSPTYTFCREHTGGRLLLQHWDFYRLPEGESSESTGFSDEAGRPGLLIAVEWADRIAEELPPEHAILRIRIERMVGDTRALTITFPPGSVALRAALGQPLGVPVP